MIEVALSIPSRHASLILLLNIVESVCVFGLYNDLRSSTDQQLSVSLVNRLRRNGGLRCLGGTQSKNTRFVVYATSGCLHRLLRLRKEKENARLHALHFTVAPRCCRLFIAFFAAVADYEHAASCRGDRHKVTATCPP